LELALLCLPSNSRTRSTALHRHSVLTAVGSCSSSSCYCSMCICWGESREGRADGAWGLYYTQTIGVLVEISDVSVVLYVAQLMYVMMKRTSALVSLCWYCCFFLCTCLCIICSIRLQWYLVYTYRSAPQYASISLNIRKKVTWTQACNAL
jgi:hypothetical protein